MILDLAVIGLLTLWAIVGAVDGALLQGARLAAAAGAGLLGIPLGERLAPAIVAETPLPLGFATPVAVALCCVGLYFLLGYAFRRLARAATAQRDVRAVDRAAGAFFGALQAAVIAWFLLSILVAIEERTHVDLGSEGSLAASLAREHNFFSALRGDEAEAAAAPATGA